MNDYQAEISQRDSRLGQIDSQMQVDKESCPASSPVGHGQQVVEIQQ